MAGEEAVSDEEHTTFQPAEDAETVAQNPEQAATTPGKWEMPKPVFQKTSGYLPQGFEKVLAEAKQADGNAATSAAAVSAPAPEPAPEPPPAVEPQPDISEQIGLPEIVALPSAAPKAKSALLRIVLAVLVIAGILFLVTAFLVAVYFLFLAPTE